MIFVCPGCQSRFRVARMPESGKITCPKCDRVSKVKKPSGKAATGKSAEAKDGSVLSPGDKIGGHTIEKYIGSTRHITIYRAVQTSMGRKVMLRLLKPEFASDKSVRDRFFGEARAAASFNHPNLLSVFDMSEEGGNCFYATEYLEGSPLARYIGADGRTARQRLEVAVQITKALVAAESAGVERVWLEQDDVWVSENGDVRVKNVGVDPPLEGGEPTTLMEALARLMYLVATGEKLPAGVWNSGKAVPVPEGRQPLETKLNALVGRLVNEGEEAYDSVTAFASELEGLLDHARRRSTVDATAAPGGIVPLRLEKAHRREFPIKSVLVGTIVVAALAGLTVFFILSSARQRRREEESEQLWSAAVNIIRADNPTNEELRSAVQKMQTLTQEYPNLRWGREARSQGVETAKARLIQIVYDRAEREHPALELANVRVSLQAAHEKLSSIPELDGFAPVDDQLEQRMENARIRYENAAHEDWTEQVWTKVRAFNRPHRMQYGSALEELEEFKERWSESERYVELADEKAEETREAAAERFKEIMERVDGYIEDGEPDNARTLLQRVIESFGIDEYVDKAEAKLDEI